MQTVNPKHCFLHFLFKQRKENKHKKLLLKLIVMQSVLHLIVVNGWKNNSVV